MSAENAIAATFAAATAAAAATADYDDAYAAAAAAEMAKAIEEADWHEVLGYVPVSELLWNRRPGEDMEDFLRRAWREICAINDGPDFDPETPYPFRRWARQVERELAYDE